MYHSIKFISVTHITTFSNCSTTTLIHTEKYTEEAQRNALYFEARTPIKVGEGVPGSSFVQARRNPIDAPCCSPIVPGFPVVVEGEGRKHLIGSEIGRHPRLCLRYFVRSGARGSAKGIGYLPRCQRSGPAN